jgi:hypothetical protein
MSRNRICWIIFAAAAVAASVAVARRELRLLGQADAQAAERQRHLKFTGIQAENRRLKAEQASEGERGRLEAAHAEADALRSRLRELQAKGAGADPSASLANDEAEVVAEGDWIYAGRADPRAAIESVLWAASRGDVEQLSQLIGFTHDVRVQAEEAFAQLPAESRAEFGGPEKVVATLLAGSFPKDADSMTLLVSKVWDQDAGVQMTVGHSDGQDRTNIYHLRRAADGWQLMVPASVLSGYQSILRGDPQSPETPSP